MKKIKIPLYFEKLEIIVTKKIPGGFGSCVEIKKNKIIVHIHPKASAGMIAHEALHVVNTVFKRCHIEPDLNKDEPQAYLLEWVVDKITKEVKSNKMKTLKECKDEVAITKGFKSWSYVFQSQEGFYLDEISKLYAKEVAQQALIDASENAELVETIKNSAVYDKINKDPILNTPIKLL